MTFRFRSRGTCAVLLLALLVLAAGCGGGGQGPGQPASTGAAAPSGAEGPSPGMAPPAPPDLATAARPYRPDALLVKFRTKQMARSTEAAGLRLERLRSFPRIGVHLVGLEPGQDVESACRRLEALPEVEYAEPDFVHTLDETVPTDPHFAQLWGLRNTGQSGGLAGADIEASLAWDSSTGSSTIVVGVIDTGVDPHHPDLAANMWRNPDEIGGNGLDDDANGYVDDVYGINAITGSGDPYDDHYHGTHVAGTVAARMGNGVGVVGVAPNVRIMALKFLDADGRGYTSDAVACVDYAVAEGAHLTSNSWGGGGYSQALYDAIARAAAADQLFVAAAGNWGSDNDDWFHYPSSYDLPNVISVGSSTRHEQVSDFSNYGLTSVDLFAPGSDILSTSPGGGYRTLSGTSMATPHVTGVAALLLSLDPDQGHAVVKNRLLSTVETLGPYAGRCVSGGRLNAAAALSGSAPSTWLGSVSPSVVHEGDTVQLAGAGFGATQGAGRVTFQGAEATTVLSWTDSQIRVAVPAGARTGSVSVLTGSGQRTNSVFLTVELQATYGYHAATYQWREIATTGTPLWLFDNYSRDVDLGFSFEFYGRTFTKVTVGSNGYLTFTAYGNMYPNQRLPNGDIANDMIAPFWDDLDPTKGDRPLVLHQTLGTAPNREFVVTYLRVPHHDIDGACTLQAVLREGSNDVLFQYQDVDFGDSGYDGGASASIGVENPDGTEGTQYPSLVAAGTALRFYPQNGAPAPEPEPSPAPGVARLDAVSPSSPRVGDLVTLHGAAFGSSQGNGYVSLPGAPRVTTVETWTDTRIELRLPPSAVEGRVSVVNDGGDRSNEQATTVDRSTSYAWEPFPYEWRDASSHHGLTLSDNQMTSRSLGFSFPFFGRPFSSAYICSNGFIVFELTAAVYPNQAIPYPNFPNNMIAPFWDDLNPGAGGSVRHGTAGTAPSRESVITWQDVPHKDGTSPLTLQAVLREATGDMIFQYQDVGLGSAALDGGASASIGVEDATGFFGLQRPGLVADGTAVRFYPVPVDQGVTGSLPLQPGWNMVTFPVSRLDSLVLGDNLHPQLYSFDGSGYLAVDPRTAPINSRGSGQAFWVRSTGSGQLDYAGLKTDDRASGVDLVAGWNLVGSPAEADLPLADMVLTPASTGEPLPLTGAVSEQVPLPAGAWIYRYGFTFHDGQYETVDLSEGAGTLDSARGMWVFLREPARLEFW